MAKPAQTIQDVVAQFTKRSKDKLVYLYERWQDEKEYESWGDYEQQMEKLCLPPMQYISSSKRPFGMRYRIGKRILETSLKVKGGNLVLSTWIVGSA